MAEFSDPELTHLKINWQRQERERIIKLIERQLCFDALAAADGRCEHHGGKCYELRLLIIHLEEEYRWL